MTATQPLRSDSLPTVGIRMNSMTALRPFILQENGTTDSPATQQKDSTANPPTTPPKDYATNNTDIQPIEVLSSAASTDSMDATDSTDSTALHAAEPIYRTVEPQEIFGAASIRTPQAEVPAPDPAPLRPLTDTPYFETLVLLLTAAYAIFLYRHLNDIVLLLGRVFRPRASHDRLVDASGGGNNILRFLDIAAVIGLFALGAAITRYADTRRPAEETATWPRELVATASLLVAAVWVAIIAYQSIVLKTVGAVTLSLPLMDQIWMLKRTYFALAAIVATPVFLLLTLVPSAAGMTWFYIAAGVSAVTAILCLRETSQLFLAKKIPILYWFLYLCIVEIFPFSLLWLIATR